MGKKGLDVSKDRGEIRGKGAECLVAKGSAGVTHQLILYGRKKTTKSRTPK